jgi:hypothetical protein
MIALHLNRGATRLGGLSFSIMEASADYYWVPSLKGLPARGTPREVEDAELRRARGRWQAFLLRRDIDARRELVWRSLRGLVGVEFYDARWSRLYSWLTTLSRLLSPFLVLCGVALMLAAPWRAEDLGWRAAAILVVVLLIGQNLVLGPNPRFVLPLLPAVLVLGITSAFLTGWRTSSLAAGGALLALLLALALRIPGTVAWEWGMVEASGVSLRQRIPRGRLPKLGTLHVRIAAPVVPTGAQLEIRGPEDELLYDSMRDHQRTQPDVRFRISPTLSLTNTREPIDLRFISRGSYDAFNYLLFPVVPPPWGPGMERAGSDVLSPGTGLRFGGLDWWTHEGWP